MRINYDSQFVVDGVRTMWWPGQQPPEEMNDMDFEDAYLTVHVGHVSMDLKVSQWRRVMTKVLQAISEKEAERQEIARELPLRSACEGK